MLSAIPRVIFLSSFFFFSPGPIPHNHLEEVKCLQSAACLCRREAAVRRGECALIEGEDCVAAPDNLPPDESLQGSEQKSNRAAARKARRIASQRATAGRNETNAASAPRPGSITPPQPSPSCRITAGQETRHSISAAKHTRLHLPHLPNTSPSATATHSPTTTQPLTCCYSRIIGTLHHDTANLYGSINIYMRKTNVPKRKKIRSRVKVGRPLTPAS